MSGGSQETPNAKPPSQPKTVVPHMLCDCCSRIVKKSEIIQALGTGRLGTWKENIFNELFFHNDSPNYLSESSAAGCHLCSLVTSSFPKQDGFYVLVSYPHRGFCPLLYFLSNQDGLFTGGDRKLDGYSEFRLQSPFMCLQLGTLTNEENPTSMEHPPPFSNTLYSTSTSSQDSVSIIRSWINYCSRYHPNCNRTTFYTENTEYTSLPTRLIDVGEADGELAPRLVLTSTSVSRSIKYLTLSHSWAITSTDSTLKLTKRNLRDLQKRIPLETLPRTFEEAMKLTRHLGYRYIWIDSLCILQDSNADWHGEALTMSTIYGNSSCNIAAMGVGGVDACFVQRNPLEFVPCRITQQEGMNAAYAFDRDHQDVPLLNRGWVLQERLLSPRVIYYGMKEMYWECRSQTASEAFPSLAPEGQLSTYWWNSFLFGYTDRVRCAKSDFESLCGQEAVGAEIDAMSKGVLSGIAYSNLGAFVRCWLKVVADYSGMGLTYESDRLIALAGVAKAIELSKRCTYVAGTWKELWPIDLLWTAKAVRYGSTPRRYMKKCLPTSKIPSWSWAATAWDKQFLLLNIGSVRFDLSAFISTAEILGYTTPTPAARYSGPRADEEGITLTVKGPVKKTNVKEIDGVKNKVFSCDVQVTSVFGSDPIFSWDHNPGEGVSVVLLSLMKADDYHCGLVLMLEEGVQHKDGHPCYRRVGMWEDKYSKINFHNGWDTETICLC
ncbi:heterokaryon incompatibility protein-domain-containing protein [Sordaria brevicollis]|uniref:Heterokaryon incompatibility protein-domain-containing protein n=1 Tax=Sordaria brevicollis TaxID=83679 RepID=A0AAE0P9S0_SORBR|nr:heterokaryon incompatibility protein-domain-containing protein [Sordaria brevicollis]